MSGAKLNLSFLSDSIEMNAGLFSEKEGMMEKPLVVMAVEPEKTIVSPSAFAFNVML